MAPPTKKFYKAPEENIVRMVTSRSKGAVHEQPACIQDGVKNQIFKGQIFQYQMLFEAVLGFQDRQGSTAENAQQRSKRPKLFPIQKWLHHVF